MFLKRVGSLYSTKGLGYFIADRGIHQNVAKAETCNDYLPVEINVPWGKLKGKLWGSNDKQPLLALHGWMDNAGSFDLLAPLLKNYSILAVDLPGHGLSSWIPRGMPYNYQNSILSMRLIVKYFGWDKVKLLGHSMGGELSFHYTNLFPKEVEYVISIDALAYAPKNIVNYREKQASAVDKFLNLENKFTNNPPSYPEDVAIKRWMTATQFSPSTIDATRLLMNRGAKQKDDGTFYYTRDFRLAVGGFNSCFSSEDLKILALQITCPYLVFKASKSPFVPGYWTELPEILSKNNKDFQLLEVEGPHHVHMVKPEPIANEIISFLNKFDA